LRVLPAGLRKGAKCSLALILKFECVPRTLRRFVVQVNISEGWEGKGVWKKGKRIKRSLSFKRLSGGNDDYLIVQKENITR